MLPRSLRRVTFLLVMTLAWARPLAAWDAPGHEYVAALACDRLTPGARAAVEAFARQLENPAQAYDAVTMACWMDDLRHNEAMPFHDQFLSWHFIDIPIDPRDPVPSFDPTVGDAAHVNVVQALKRAIAVLKGGSDPDIPSKAIACAMVMHLVGDIHQPLHCATKYFFTHGELHQDNGGNKEGVINGPPGDERFNLHAFWDSAWRASFDESTGFVVVDSRYDEHGSHRADNIASALPAKMPAYAGALLAPDIDGWARESNALARTFVYPGITATENRKYCRLGSGYVAKAHDLARERLDLAAARLAALLNELLGS